MRAGKSSRRLALRSGVRRRRLQGRAHGCEDAVRRGAVRHGARQRESADHRGEGDGALVVGNGLQPALRELRRQARRQGDGCPLPTLAAELGLRGQPSTTADTMVAHMTARLADSRLAAGAGHEGIVALAAMVGALTLARAVSDRDASDGILAAVRAALQPVEPEA